MSSTWKIEADARTAAVVYRRNGPLQVAEAAGYQDARAIARGLSRETSGRYTVIPPQGSSVAPESFANGTSEGTPPARGRKGA